MNLQKFERICTQSSFQPLEKQWTRHGAVLIAERHFRQGESAEHDPAHWCVLWAVERNGLDMGQKLYMEDWYEKGGIKLPLKQQQRIDAARLTATQWIEDNLESGRYA